jgi:hypothetical protein
VQPFPHPRDRDRSRLLSRFPLCIPAQLLDAIWRVCGE